MDDAMPLFDEALASCPVVFRLLDVAIPIETVEDGSLLARSWAERILSASYLFRRHPRGFTLSLDAADNKLTFRLFRMKSIQHCEGSMPIAAGEDELLASACARLVSRLMSPNLELTATDINSLDNSLFAAPQTSRTEQLIKLTDPR